MPKETAAHSLPSGFQLRSKERTYEIIRVLGAGSFGITYLASAPIVVGNITTTVKFAIKEHFISASCYRADDGVSVKTVPTAKSDVADSRADFITEANRLKKICLKSRSIVSVNETFEANGTAYYVMEYLDGGNPKKCSEEEAKEIVRQVAGALDVIHGERVLHLDVKPDNIVLKTNDKGETYPVLIDFGISKHFDSKGAPTSSLNAKGASPGYAPQEQYAGVSEFSPKYDIYALGAVLYFLITGKNPPDAFKVSPGQRELRNELESKASAPLVETVLKAMSPSAYERTPSISAFLADLDGQSDKRKAEEEKRKKDEERERLRREKEEEERLRKKQADEEKLRRKRQTEALKKKREKEKTKGTEIFGGKHAGFKINKRGVFIGIGLVLAVILVIFIVNMSLTPERVDVPVPPITEELSEETVAESENKSENVSRTETTTPEEKPVEEEKVKERPALDDKPAAVETSKEAKIPTDDELFERAKTIADYQALADKGYAKAYAPLAELYLRKRNYKAADNYVRKALAANVGRQKAIEVIQYLEKAGLYDNGENGGKPSY